MSIRLLPVTMIVSVAIMAGAACSTSDPQPPPVPAVESPKGLVGIDPCTLIDSGTRSRHGLAEGEPGQDELGASCRWTGSGPKSVQLTAYTSGGGLADLTKRVDPAAQRVRLSGYPALETFTAGGAFCRYDVGVADAAAVVATMDGGRPDSCTALQELLTAVLSRLPASG